MPAPFGLERPHHLGSNARIYIAQEGATRGPRRLHLHVQEHNSRDARPKDTRVDLLWRASKKVPASLPYTRVERYARPPLRRAYRDARAIRASKKIRASASSCARQRWPPQHGRVQRCTRRLCCPHREDARVWAVMELRPSLCCLRSSSYFLPTIRSNVRREFGYKRSLSSFDKPPVRSW